jgi:hypothetical protein
MTDQAPFIKYQASHPIRVIGVFKNELSERFVIYINKNGDKPFITGDEYDWEPKVPLLWNDFTFSAEERDRIARILWPTTEERYAKVKNMAERAKPDETPEAAMDRFDQEERMTRQHVYGIVYDGNPRATPNNS